MATAVENRTFSHFEHHRAGPFKPAPQSQNPFISPSDSTFKNNNNNNNSSSSGITVVAHEDYNSSGDDDIVNHDVNKRNKKYLSGIKKANAELEPSIQDPRHESTPDSWVQRNPAMFRLTGKHPFNAEAPLPRLMHHGFITPAPLHYVRSHGPVPRGSWDDWRVEVTGLVERPAKFTMNQLMTEFPAMELPVTLVCAGNRRMEYNMVKKTVGFNFGAGGVSTSLWRGVALRVVLRQCGVLSRTSGALNVCFEGAEDLPGCGGSKYGTSLSIDMAMDPARDIMVAYMQNGERLLPDHGFPVRLIVPGIVGGRMVKWLKRIVVTPNESDNYYHLRDNKLFPSHVDSELANAEGWWNKPEHVINELNINSVITTPSHDEILPINSFTTQRPYTLRGYSYSGGGKKVRRVEVTMDGGVTWQQCELDHPEKPNKYGKYWCWCFWSLEVEVLDFLSAKEIAVRAWDETHNTQPEKLIWNALGMFNNCWFRVKTNICKPQQGEIGIVFEHPTQTGDQPGGWMTKEKFSNEKYTVKMNTTAKMHSMSGVKKNRSPDSKLTWNFMGIMNNCWSRGKTNDSKLHKGKIGIDFDRSTQSRFQYGSHLEKSSNENHTINNSISSPSMNTTANMYTMADVKKHSSPNSAWIIVHGNVYDCTRFLKDHPGGADSILINIGTDCTEEFDAIHSEKAKKMLEEYRIGELTTTVHGPTTNSYSAPMKEITPAARSVALSPRERIPVKLIGKTSLSHDVRLLRFALPTEDHVLGLPVGKHVFVCAKINGKLCMRAYTPSSDVDTVGHFDLVVKVYFRDVNPRFPNGGLMSQHLDSVELGEFIEVKGPVGHVEYAGRGNFKVQGKNKFAKKLAMIAGGTGITPIYQVMQAILKDPEDETEMHVVYANRTEDDILLRDELDSWSRKYPGRVNVWYVISSSVKEGWKYSLGRVTENILREHIPVATKYSLALVCGPPAMMQDTVNPSLEKMGYDLKDTLLVF